MASKTDEFDVGAICKDCATIFQGEQKIFHWPKREFKPHTNTTRPEKCRICWLIWSRHARRVAEAGSYQKTLLPVKMSYELRSSFLAPQKDVHPDALELRLELRYDDGDTLLVSLAMLPAESDHGPPAVEVLSSATSSEESFGFIKSKLKTCLEIHQACRARADRGDSLWRPRRLLKINDMADTVYLRDGMDAESEPYATLSHCWGDSKPTRLTSDTEQTFRTGIRVGSLPKTFKDALHVAKRLSIEYLWIDSLCIFQDDPNDWFQEATTMCDVYSNCLLNIAATAARDSLVGLFFSRDSFAECAFNIHTSWDLKSDFTDKTHPSGVYRVFPSNHWADDVEDGLLNQRAWVMQERFLSPRILHFSATQVFWECRENTSSELFPDAMHPVSRPFWFLNGQNLLKNAVFRSRRGKSWEDEIYYGWRPLVKAFTRCKLTKESDRLVAVHGVQKLLAKFTGDEFICGLSSRNLFQELCWTRHPRIAQPAPYRPMRWRAPSWSWAGSNVHSVHPGMLRLH